MRYRQESREAGVQDFTYDDFWSFDIDQYKWTQERLQGNFASPRGGDSVRVQ